MTQQWEAHRLEMGMTPEMSEALTMFRGVIGNVLDEIAAADLNAYGVRMSRLADNSEIRALGRRHALTEQTRDAIEVEGLAGLKRSWLESSARRLDSDFLAIINALVDLRVDLIASQQE